MLEDLRKLERTEIFIGLQCRSPGKVKDFDFLGVPTYALLLLQHSTKIPNLAVNGRRPPGDGLI